MHLSTFCGLHRDTEQYQVNIYSVRCTAVWLVYLYCVRYGLYSSVADLPLLCEVWVVQQCS
jgi:hypothetical protein